MSKNRGTTLLKDLGRCVGRSLRSKVCILNPAVRGGQVFSRHGKVVDRAAQAVLDGTELGAVIGHFDDGCVECCKAQLSVLLGQGIGTFFTATDVQ